MYRWLRPWFLWRFGLSRLVIAVVFLGAFVGLNMRVIGPQGHGQFGTLYSWGWPLPHEQKPGITSDQFCVHRHLKPSGYYVFDGDWYAHMAAVHSYQIPYTHLTYCLVRDDEGTSIPSFVLLLNAALDTLFAAAALFMILFLQIPSRKEAARTGE